MKKLGIFIFALLFTGWGMVQAQQPQSGNALMRNDFQQKVLPFIQKQQARLIQALTPSEKATLQQLRKEMAQFKAQGAQMRKAMQGNFNQQAWNARKAQFDAILAKAHLLVDAHPNEAAAYKKAVRDELAGWENRMPAMGQGRMGPASHGHSMMGNTPSSRFKKLSDPAMVLLMNTKDMNEMGRRSPRGMQRGNGMQGKRMQGNRNMARNQGNKWLANHRMGQQGAIMMAMRQPAVREKIKSYREKNVLPVIRAQREAFDKVLSKKEKKVIADARDQMQNLLSQRMQMRNQGARPSDSSRLALQQQMDKNRMAIREIMLHHYAAFQKAIAPIKEKMPQWRSDIRKIVAESVVEQQMQRMAGKFEKAHPFLKEKSGMMFLLMDPAHPDNFNYLQFFGGNKKR
jgi:hypothetical protein